MLLNASLQKLLEVTGGQCELDPSFVIEKVSSLKNAGPNDIAVFFDPEEGSVFDNYSTDELKLSQAGLILASKPVIEGKMYLVVEDPLIAFQKLALFKMGRQEEVHGSAVLHETVILEDKVAIGAGTVVEKGARVGENTVIGAQVFLGKKVRIGRDVILHPGVKVLDGTIIGDYSVIQGGTVIGGDGFGYHVSNKGMRKIPHVGIVRIGSHVEIGTNVSIDRAAFDETVIEDGVKIDNLVHIAHNVHIGPGTAILAHTSIAGTVRIGAGCMIGGQVAIKDHVTIGNGVKIVSKSGIMKDLKDGEIVAGVPSMPFSEWKRVMVSLRRLPEMIKMGSDLQKKLSSKKSIKEKFFG